MRFILTIIILVGISFVSASLIQAQTMESNEVITQVGNPQGTNTAPSSEASDCPIPKGVVTCGSKYTPVGGCGHCGIGYEKWINDEQCIANYKEGTFNAIDIGGNDLQDVYLPKVKGHTIEWTFSPQGTVEGKTQAIIAYTGVDTETKEKYYIQFHHSQLGSQNPGVHRSGEVGAKICNCGQKHTHVQIAKGDRQWLDAAQYFCKP